MALDINDTVGTVKDTVGTVSDRMGTISRRIAREIPKIANDTTAIKRLVRGSQLSSRETTRRQGGGWSRLIMTLLGAAAGATALYFLDRERGAGRRAQAKDQLGSLVRRGQGQVTQLSRRAGGNATGWSQKMVHLRSGQRPVVDDLTLRDRVESEIFRNTELPKGRINLDVESAIVTIRGQVDSAYEITTIEKAVLKVPGVNGVENLMHVQGTPAPNKAEARQSAS